MGKETKGKTQKLKEELESLKEGYNSEKEKARAFLISKEIKELKEKLGIVKKIAKKCLDENEREEKIWKFSVNIITPKGKHPWYLEKPPLEELKLLDLFIDEENRKLLQICVWKPKGLITEVKRLDRNSIQLTYAGEMPVLFPQNAFVVAVSGIIAIILTGIITVGNGIFSGSEFIRLMVLAPFVLAGTVMIPIILGSPLLLLAELFGGKGKE